MLDHEKAKLLQPGNSFSDDQPQYAECNSVQGNISSTLRLAAATKKPFLSGEEWGEHKLSFEPGKLLPDRDFIVAMAGKSVDDLKRKPDRFSLDIKCLMKSYQDVGSLASNFFSQDCEPYQGTCEANRVWEL